eukprot:366229-Chlamydomonas_euryale.AAC.9
MKGSYLGAILSAAGSQDMRQPTQSGETRQHRARGTYCNRCAHVWGRNNMRTGNIMPLPQKGQARET